MGELKKSWRESSRENFTQKDFMPVTTESINAGSFQRMADSLEMIAKDKTRLEKDAQYWKESSKKKDEEIVLLTNRIRGLRSRITTLLANITRLGGAHE